MIKINKDKVVKAITKINIVGSLICGSVIAAGRIEGFGVMVASAIGAGGVIAGADIGVSKLFDSKKISRKTKKIVTAVSSLLVATTILGAGMSLQNYKKEYAVQQEIIAQEKRLKEKEMVENTFPFSEELDVKGSFNKITNTLTITEIEKENIPADAKIKLDLNN